LPLLGLRPAGIKAVFNRSSEGMRDWRQTAANKSP
jgi:hypothetical protein